MNYQPIFLLHLKFSVTSIFLTSYYFYLNIQTSDSTTLFHGGVVRRVVKHYYSWCYLIVTKLSAGV